MAAGEAPVLGHEMHIKNLELEWIYFVYRIIFRSKRAFYSLSGTQETFSSSEFGVTCVTKPYLEVIICECKHLLSNLTRRAS